MTWKMIFILMAFLHGPLWAAPAPGTSSSSLIGADQGLFMSEHGFSIHAGRTTWIQTPPPKDIPSLTTLYRSPRTTLGVQPSLTVRVDRLKKETPLKLYVKQWMKDYPRLGLEVLASKSVKVNGQEGYVVDVINREVAKQIRQVVFLKERTAVVLTCRDHRDSFDKTLQTCNEIIRNFQWRK